MDDHERRRLSDLEATNARLLKELEDLKVSKWREVTSEKLRCVPWHKLPTELLRDVLQLIEIAESKQPHGRLSW
jgi:hypothetical protein